MNKYLPIESTGLPARSEAPDTAGHSPKSRETQKSIAREVYFFFLFLFNSRVEIRRPFQFVSHYKILLANERDENPPTQARFAHRDNVRCNFPSLG